MVRPANEKVGELYKSSVHVQNEESAEDWFSRSFCEMCYFAKIGAAIWHKKTF